VAIAGSSVYRRVALNGALGAVDGGGHFNRGFGLGSFVPEAETLKLRTWSLFTLIRQPDGHYAIQTFTGNYVTAVAGGGVGPVENGQAADVFHTDAIKIGAWEKFVIIDQGDCSYIIQTASGNYVGIAPFGGVPGFGLIRTDITETADAAKFRLTPSFSETGPLP
jgi:hypothetical protein